MYVIKHDGKEIYSPAVMSMSRRVLAPKVSLDINANGSCTFVLPPGHPAAGEIRRRKSIITVEQDGQEIFRGRVLDEENDRYKQKSVYCEGVRGYLNDSQAAPYSYKGTPRGLLEKLIAEHNDQVEEDKRFTLGEVTVDRADEALECESVAYRETLKEIDEKLLGAYGGYLRARKEGGVLYLDWVNEYGRANPQKIRFAVNLLDIKDKNDSAGMFTILRPLGASTLNDAGEYGAALTVASVNGGRDYIMDDEAVARYGRIWKTQTWAHIEDPAALLAKGRDFLKIGAELRTITLKAIDMHFLDGSVDAIRVGDKVHILSQPHGIDIEKVCCRIEIDIANPENTMYTFGEPAKALTDNFVKAEEEIDGMTGYKGGGGGRASVQEEAKEILRWARISVDELNAHIDLNAGEINNLTGRMSQAEIDIDGANAEILLKASQSSVDDLGERMSQAEIDIDGANAEILLKASQSSVDDLGERMSQAEIDIDGANAEILLKASQSSVDDLGERMSQAEIDIDGANAEILLKASKTDVDDLGERMSQAEIDIDGANAEILLKASQSSVDDLGERMSQAEIDIDGANSEILLKANKIDLQGYVTASQFSALESDIAQMMAGTVQASHLYTQNLTATNTVRLAGHTCVWKKLEVVTGVSISKSYATVPGSNGADYVVIGGVSLSKETEEIKYFGRD